MPAHRCIFAALVLFGVSCGDVAEVSPTAASVSSDDGAVSAAGRTRTGRLPPGSPDDYLRDPAIGHVRKPHFEKSFEWAEHPDGRLTMATNGLGFREDEPTPPRPEPGVVRVLMTGDSHLDGVMNNAESFPNVLEARLDAEGDDDGARFEVINGGTGFYGPPHYARFLEKHVELEPAVFVVAVYCGNDFLDASRGVEFREGRLERPADYVPALKRAVRACPPGVAQALNQAAYMHAFPEMRARALDFTVQQFDTIRSLCDEHEIALRVVLWSSLVLAQPQLDAERWRAAAAILGLDEADLGVERELGDGLLRALTAAGVDVLDMRARIAEDDEPCYWVKDHHLSTRGHAVTAEAFHAAYPELFAALAAEAR